MPASSPSSPPDDGRLRHYWFVAVLTLVGLDPLTTALAVGTGAGVEGNALLVGHVARGEWLSIVAVKTAAVGLSWTVWRVVPDWQFHGLLPRLAAGMGCLAVANNLAVLLVSGVALEFVAFLAVAV